jgi:UPF0755 protein
MMMFLSYLRAMWNALLLHAGRTPIRLTGFTLTILVLLGIASFLYFPPASFPRGALIEVPEDASFGEIAVLLEEKNVVSSSFVLRVFARLSGNDREVDAGTYLFETPQTVFAILARLSQGDHGLPLVRVTFPEGMSTREMGIVLSKTLAGFNETEWAGATKDLEGYLFPDTYNFFKDAPVEELIVRMQENFEERTKKLQEEAVTRAIRFEDMVTMASLIEKEANTEESRHIVSGILWSRIEAGVALQVDAVFPYIRGNPDHIPNGDDPELESPYNTYLNRGLPPGPITNPGLDALDAALHPTETDYFYYLTGTDGVMYYAEDFEGHKRNVELHLD